MTGRRKLVSRLLLITGAVVAVAGVACSSDAAPATGNVSATSTAIAVVSPSPVPTSATITLPPTARPTASSTVPPPPFPSLEFVDNPDCADISRAPLSLADVTITDGTHTTSVVAEMAVSGTDQSQGLMCRASVPGGAGMLFLWDEEVTGGFWMFNTYVPLDILFFGGTNGGVSIIQMAPCPRDGDEETTVWRSRCGLEAASYRPAISYTTALELPQGWLESQGLDTADPSKIVVSLIARQ